MYMVISRIQYELDLNVILRNECEPYMNEILVTKYELEWKC